MMIMIVILAMISILLAFFSLRHLEKRQEVEHVKKILKKGKVIYYRDSSTSSR